MCNLAGGRSRPAGIAEAANLLDYSLSRRSTMWHISSILCASCLLWSVADGASAQDQIPWQPNLETAQRVARRASGWCSFTFGRLGASRVVNWSKASFAQPETGKALEANFVMVKLNVDDSPATARMYYVSSLPTDVIIAPNGHLVAALPSPLTAPQYIATMNQAAEGHRRLAASGSPAAANQAAALQSLWPQAAASAAPRPNTEASQPPAGQQPVVAAAAVSRRSVVSLAYQGEVAAPARRRQPNERQCCRAGCIGRGCAAADRLATGRAAAGLGWLLPGDAGRAKRWAKGDTQWGAIHRGRTYLFASSEAQRRFLANPDAYSPVIEGNDPVLALDNRQLVPGSRTLGVFFEKRVYLFSCEETLRRFEQNPKRYAAEIVQAMR